MQKRAITFLKILSIFGLLYLFLSSISLMGGSFKLFGKEFAKQLITTTSNPFAGLFIGILATSLIQSSSTTTSMVVGLAGSGMLPLSCCIPIIMGANVGTSITNTLVSLTFVTRKADFRRAFEAATVHDFFNLFAVAVFFPLELMFGIIEKSALWFTAVCNGAGGFKFTSPLKMIIKPFVKGVKHFLHDTMGCTDVVTGSIMLVLSIIILILSLTFLVKTMRYLVMNKAETFMNKYLFRNDAIALVLGLCITVSVQSSSVTTSLLVPLVAAGILSLERCYPVTLGANIGTTCTAILASLATVKGDMTVGVTVAFAHLMFNIMGICVFYPLRKLPLTCAVKFAEMAEKSKKWVVAYILVIFFVLPLLTILLTKNL